MNQLLSGLIVGVMLFLTGCSSTPQKKPFSFDGHFPPEQEFWAEQKLRREKLAVLQGKITVRFSNSRQKGIGKGTILSSLSSEKGKLEVRDPLGRMGYVLIADGDEVSAYYPAEKKKFLDKSGGKKYLGRFLKIPLTFADFQKVLLGLAPTDKESFTKWAWNPTTKMADAVLTTKSTSLRFEIDPQTLTVRTATISVGKEQTTLQFSDFQYCCNVGRLGQTHVNVAQNIRISQSTPPSRVEIEWNDMKPEEDLPSDALKFSDENFQQITL